jgi:hypothetical protein
MPCAAAPPGSSIKATATPEKLEPLGAEEVPPPSDSWPSSGPVLLVNHPPVWDSTRWACSLNVLHMEQPSLFPDPRPTLTDEEVIAAFRAAISRSSRLSRLADLFLCTVCAEHLVDELHLAGLEVVCTVPERLHD